MFYYIVFFPISVPLTIVLLYILYRMYSFIAIHIDEKFGKVDICKMEKKSNMIDISSIELDYLHSLEVYNEKDVLMREECDIYESIMRVRDRRNTSKDKPSDEDVLPSSCQEDAVSIFYHD